MDMAEPNILCVPISVAHNLRDSDIDQACQDNIVVLTDKNEVIAISEQSKQSWESENQETGN